MNQAKVGKFICKNEKKQNLTQCETDKEKAMVSDNDFGRKALI